jgi:hypothetical protein
MPKETVRLRYEGPARRFRVPAFDVDVEQGESFTVDAAATVDLADDDNEADVVALSTYLTDHLGAEVSHATDWYDVLDESVPDLREALATGDYDGRLDALAHAEREGENRTTALAAIHDRQEAIE